MLAATSGGPLNTGSVIILGAGCMRGGVGGRVSRRRAGIGGVGGVCWRWSAASITERCGTYFALSTLAVCGGVCGGGAAANTATDGGAGTTTERGGTTTESGLVATDDCLEFGQRSGVCCHLKPGDVARAGITGAPSVRSRTVDTNWNMLAPCVDSSLTSWGALWRTASDGDFMGCDLPCCLAASTAAEGTFELGNISRECAQ